MRRGQTLYAIGKLTHLDVFKLFLALCAIFLVIFYLLPQLPGGAFAANQRLDPNYTAADPNNTVFGSHKLSNGQTIIWGSFTAIDGNTAYPDLARLNADGSLDTAFSIGTGLAGGAVADVAELSDGRLAIVGTFTSVNGTGSNRVALLTTTGAVDGTFALGTGFDASAQSVEVDSNDDIMIVGDFTDYNGNTAVSDHLVKLNTDGTIDASWVSTGITPTGGLLTILGLISGDRFMIGGVAQNYDGTAFANMGIINNNGSIDGTWPTTTGASFTSGPRFLGELSDGSFVFTENSATTWTGSTTEGNTNANTLFRVTATGTLDNNFASNTTFTAPGSNSPVLAMTELSDGSLVIGGYFTHIDGVTSTRIGRLNADGSRDTSFDISDTTGFDNTVYSLESGTGEQFQAFGAFTTFNGVAVTGNTSIVGQAAISGTVYTDRGVTPLGSRTVRIHVDGVDSGLTDVTAADGTYSVTGTAVDNLTGTEIVTVFIDNETENGVTIVDSVVSGTMSGIDIYQDYLSIRGISTTSTLTGTNVDTADNSSDVDITAIYTMSGSNISGVGSVGLFVTSPTFTPAGTLDFGGDIVIDTGDVLNQTTNPINVSGDFLNLGTLTHASTLTFNGTLAQSFRAGSSQIGSDILVTNNSGNVVSLVTTSLQTSGALTTNANTILYTNGQNMSVSSTINNSGIIRSIGNETFLLTPDIAKGTWEYVGDGTPGTFTVAEFSKGVDYFDLVIIDSSTSSGAVFQLASSSEIFGSLTVTSGTFDMLAFDVSVTGSVAIAASGTLATSAGTQTTTVGTDWTNNGTFTAGAGTVYFDSAANDHTITGTTTFFNVTVIEDNDTDDATLTIADTQTVSGILRLDGVDANDRVLVVGSGGASVFNVLGGSSNVAADFVDINANTLQDNGTTMDPAYDPANGTRSGLADGWYIFGVIVTSTNASTTVTEGATTDTIEVVLASQPTADVIVSLIANGGQVTFSSTPITFTTANWNVTSTITVTAVDDTQVEGLHTDTIRYSVTSADTAYNGLSVTSSVTTTIIDNEIPGISVSPTTTNIAENAGTINLSVVLDAEPTSTVVLTVTSSISGNATISTTTLVFTSTTWNIVQTVVVTGVDDNSVNGTARSSLITVAVDPALSNDQYDSVSDATSTITLVDDNTFGPSISTSSISVTEGGATASVDVALGSQPTSTVTSTLTLSTSQVTLGSTELVFTTANWSATQTVSVVAIDDSTVEGSHTDAITYTFTSTDTNFNGLVFSNSTTVNITDNDTASSGSSSSGGAGLPHAYVAPPTTPASSGGLLDEEDVVATDGDADADSSDDSTSIGATTPVSSGPQSAASANDLSQQSTPCLPLDSYIRRGNPNSTDVVRKLESFLNSYEDAGLPVDGIYDEADEAAVIAFQEKYATDVLGPWGISRGTGYVFQTTVKKINEIQCEGDDPTEQEIPGQTAGELFVIENLDLLCPGFDTPLRRGATGEKVAEMQQFLSVEMDRTFPESGVFGLATEQAVSAFQRKYAEDILTPWGIDSPTGYWYRTTPRKANEILGCLVPDVTEVLE